MKLNLLIAILCCPLALMAQDKQSYVRYNKLVEVKGTPYVIATVVNGGKTGKSNHFLLFVNTGTNDSREITMPEGAHLNEVQQVKIDSLNINKIVLSARTVNLDGNKSIDWSDPEQIIILSPDGREKTQITDNNFFVSGWTVNNHTGRMVIAGHRDTNNNGKLDNSDLNEILVYDLKQMRMLGK